MPSLTLPKTAVNAPLSVLKADIVFFFPA